jgi:predicted N-acetyltransferase YhbS
MTQEILFRPIQSKDYDDLHRLTRGAWFSEDYKKYPTATNAFVDLDIIHALSDTSFGRVAVVDGQVAGLILASANQASKDLRMIVPSPKEAILTLHHQEAAVRDYFYKMMAEEQRADDDLYHKASQSVNYQGRIVLFIVDPNFQGLGLGGRLFRLANEYFTEQGVDKYYLFTDTSCDYSFYEHKGLRQVNHIRIDENHPYEVFQNGDKEKPFTFFLYDNQ